MTLSATADNHVMSIATVSRMGGSPAAGASWAASPLKGRMGWALQVSPNHSGRHAWLILSQCIFCASVHDEGQAEIPVFFFFLCSKSKKLWSKNLITSAKSPSAWGKMSHYCYFTFFRHTLQSFFAFAYLFVKVAWQLKQQIIWKW